MTTFAGLRGRRVLPESLHAAAFLTYILAAGWLTEMLLLISTPNPLCERTDSFTPGASNTGDQCWSPTIDGLPLQAFFLLGVMLAAAGAGVHWGLRRARELLSLALAAHLLTVIFAERSSISDALYGTGFFKVAASIVICVVIIVLMASRSATSFHQEAGRTHAEALADPDRAGHATAPAVIWLCVTYCGLAVIAIGHVLIELEEAQYAPPLLINVVMSILVARGLLNGRLWARAYTLIVFTAAALSGIAGLVKTLILASDPVTPESSDLTGVIVTYAAVLAVHSGLLYALSLNYDTTVFFAHGR
ncbi:hypothetical protein HII36_26870 [Nonomuraea sp. NN258]|uniref:hypothetical protein n=1 Tax=Nonomuraea antri TaxID=2730852 RepID=UPI0015686237|nr:hypothetical protein [Nonomuraea antri]NRQ35425.1 hypothetical protein [Nonomuraea antri]